VSIIGTGIDELGAGQTFNVYPNPNNGSFTLNYTTTDAENISVQITDATGRLIWMDAPQSSSLQYTKQVNLEGVAKGVYFLRLNTGERMITRRVIVD
jgi:hypothetical protein